MSIQTARHELNLLRTAVSYYHGSYGPLTAIPLVTLPEAPPPRLDYSLTRKEVADRIRVARKNKRWRHVVRMLLIGVYSGSRPGTTVKLRWVPSIDGKGGWFDLETGDASSARAKGRHQQESREPLPHTQKAFAVAQALEGAR